jgi:periplasmic copper chaperone A
MTNMTMTMKKILAPLLLATAWAAAQAAAPVDVQGAWARPIVKGQDSSGAYMTITARAPLTLLGAESPAAGIVEIHEMKMEGDVMKMRAAGALPLAPGKPLKLAPGGFHFMLMDLKAPFQAGSHITMTLRFRDAQGKVDTLQVPVPVQVTAPRPKDRQ